jgi:hypothetical protein
MKLVSIIKLHDDTKKYRATFKLDDGTIKKVKFGASGYSDYTIHRDNERKKRYLARHKKRENWNNPITPGALSRWILWNKPTLNASVVDFRERFNL